MMKHELTSKAYLQRLINEGEHQQQDFKYRVEDAEKLARSVSAFANTDGGRLLIGVRDDGFISGVRSEEEIYVMHQAAYRYCRPEASIKFDTYHVPVDNPMTGKCFMRTVVIATIPPAVRKPVYALEKAPLSSPGKAPLSSPEGDTIDKATNKIVKTGLTVGTLRSRAYIRINDENIVASPVHLAIWREEQAPQPPAFSFGDDEHRLIAALQQAPWLRLNLLVRRSQLPRQKVIALLARLCRYGLARWRLNDHQFEFGLEE
jgi:predicted HTH transcriptional regulator